MLLAGSADQVPQSLEQIRSKLQQLTTSLQALQHRLLTGAPLPPWAQVQSSLTVVLSQIGSLTDTVAKNADDLRAMSVFPNPTFPISTHEGLLTTLLRTKPLPDSEEWLSKAQIFGENLKPIPMMTFPVIEDKVDQDEDDMQLSDEFTVSEWLNAQKGMRQWTGYYTRTEINDAFEIDKDDLEDIRKTRQAEAESDMLALKTMMKFARSGR